MGLETMNGINHTLPENPIKKFETHDDNLSMPERIKKLRSRLNAAESSTAKQYHWQKVIRN